jgi:hypothetical protein
MRQVDSMSGVATIQVLIDNLVIDRLRNPYPNLPSWQWFGKQFSKPGSNLTVMMTLSDLNPPSSPVTAYFDDLCVTFSNPSSNPTGMCL